MMEIKNLLLNLSGVKEINQIAKDKRKKIVALERVYEKNGIIGLKNIGIRMVLQCDIVYALLKDENFRPPPCPTVIMVEDHNDDDEQADHLIKIAGNNYRVIGEEIIEKKLPGEEEYIFIGEDFILYPGRRTGKTRKPAYFLIPPIDFTELEEKKDLYRIDNIVSISPSTMADEYIRTICDFSTSEKLATILVGFNKRN